MGLTGNIVVWLVICCYGLPTQAKYGGGTGEPNDPYLIFDANQMNAIGADSSDWDKHFKLTADVDLRQFTGTEFNIIGYDVNSSDNKPFTGVFDGNGHTISSFNYTGGTENVGLFGVISKYEDFIKGINIPTKLAVDANDGKIYWIDEGRIRRASIDGGNIEEVINDKVNELIIDPFDRKIYWSSRWWKIKKANLDGSMIEDVVFLKGIGYAIDIAMDPNTKKVYWLQEGVIKRSNIDGTDIENIVVSQVSLGSPYQLALDSNAGKIYWINENSSGQFVFYRSNFDGSDVEMILMMQLNLPFPGSISLAIDTNDNKLYWSDASGPIYRSNLDGSNVTIFLSNLDGPKGIALDISSQKLYFSEGPDIKSINLNGTGLETLNIQKGLRDPDGIACDPVAKKVYWVDRSNNKIQRANVDGTNIENIISTQYPFGLVLDVNEGHIYYIDNYRIKRANLDGSFATSLILGNFPIDLAIDTVRNKVYWAEWSLGKIMAADLSGTGQETISSASLPKSIAIDMVHEKIYWTESAGNIIIRADLDGSNPQTIYTETYGSPVGIAVDPQGGKIYWAATSAYKIKCANLDGTNVKELLTADLRLPDNIELDCSSGMLYFTNEYHIYRTLMHGRGGEVWNLGLQLANIDCEGAYQAGAIAGKLVNGKIISCYSTGGVIGKCAVGGIVGNNRFGDVHDCYSTMNVIGESEIGGLVGRNAGPIRRCYSKGIIHGLVNVGGIVGYNAGTRDGYDVCFWNKEANPNLKGIGSALKDPANIFGEDIKTLKTNDTYIGWGCECSWNINDGNDTPKLVWENKTGAMIIDPNYGGGAGTAQNPYLISTPEHLSWLGLTRCHWNKHFKLTADIDMSEISTDNFNIIGICDYYGRTGEFGYPFTGGFDGNGKTISNLNFYTPEDDYIGLFGYVYNDDTVIKDLVLVDPIIKGPSGYGIGPLVGYLHRGACERCGVQGGRVEGYRLVGGLVGNHDGSLISDSYSSCSVSGMQSVGGLAGTNGNKISNCYSTGSILGKEDVGGLLGLNVGDIIGCYATGSVSGSTNVGGLVGFNTLANISNCYSAGSVSGNERVGGFMGFNYSSSISNCFWDSDVNPDVNGIGNTTNPNVIGESTANMQTESTFTDAGWDFITPVWKMNCEGMSYPKLNWWQPVQGDFLCPDGADFFDYSFFALQWTEENCAALNDCDGRDLDQLGSVDIKDLRIYVDNWLKGF